MRAYIDESGDPGTRGSGSRWLALGCVMLAEGAAPAVEAAVQRAREIIGGPSLPNLHFKKLHHDDKVGALNLVAAEDWTGVVVAFDKSKITPGSRLNDPQTLYNYAALFLIERVAEYAEIIQEPARVYFERSRVFDLDEFTGYIDDLRGQDDTNPNLSFISSEQLQVLRKGAAPELEIADGVAHAAFRALEQHRKWGHLEPRYMRIVMPKLLRGKTHGRIGGNGLVLMPTENLEAFRDEYSWLP